MKIMRQQDFPRILSGLKVKKTLENLYDYSIVSGWTCDVSARKVDFPMYQSHCRSTSAEFDTILRRLVCL